MQELPNAQELHVRQIFKNYQMQELHARQVFKN
jgi:hypothetical protein